MRTGEIWHLHIGGEVIRTTAEHPFWVMGKGWTETNQLQAGDLLASHEGQWTRVEEVFNTGEWERVYNLGVGECHTYFVGCKDWGFSVWCHNAGPNGCFVRLAAGKSQSIVNRGGRFADLDASTKRFFGPEG